MRNRAAPARARPAPAMRDFPDQHCGISIARRVSPVRGLQTASELRQTMFAPGVAESATGTFQFPDLSGRRSPSVKRWTRNGCG